MFPKFSMIFSSIIYLSDFFFQNLLKLRKHRKQIIKKKKINQERTVIHANSNY